MDTASSHDQGSNVDDQVVRDFGLEWSRYRQAHLSEADHLAMFEDYFSLFPWDKLPLGARGFDMGCGSGRWAQLVAPRVGELICVDPSEAALQVARSNLASFTNCSFHCASANDWASEMGSMDFGYSLGVLHHVPDTFEALRACVAHLRPGAPFLLYLYFAFDNKPRWYQQLWKASDAVRRRVCGMPQAVKVPVCALIAGFIYWPLSRLAGLCERLGYDVDTFPLSYYRNKSLYVLLTDSLDRFGTRLERRFTRQEIAELMHAAGLADIQFSRRRPYWCALGFRRI